MRKAIAGLALFLGGCSFFAPKVVEQERWAPPEGVKPTEADWDRELAVVHARLKAAGIQAEVAEDAGGITLGLPKLSVETKARLHELLSHPGKLEFVAVKDDPHAPLKDEELHLDRQDALSPVTIVRAIPQQDKQLASWEVRVDFSPESGKAFGDFTGKHVGKKIAIVLDGTVMTAPVVLDPITGGSAVITLGMAARTAAVQEAEAVRIAATLQGGALPFPLTLTRTGVPDWLLH